MTEVIVQPAARRGFSLDRLIASEEGGGFTFERLSFVFDATLSESFTKTIEWTPHPVESGSEIVDHGIIQQGVLTLQGFLTETPLAKEDVRSARLESMRLELEELADQRQRLEVFGSDRVYQSMVIETLNISRSPEQEALIVDMTLRQIEVVEATEVEIPPDILAPKLRAGGTSKLKAGQQTGTQDAPESPTKAATKRTESLAVKLVDGGVKHLEALQ